MEGIELLESLTYYSNAKQEIVARPEMKDMFFIATVIW